MDRRMLAAMLCCALSAGVATPASAQTVAELQRQIDELKATVAELKAQLQTRAPQPMGVPPASVPAAPAAQAVAAAPAAPPVRAAAASPPAAAPRDHLYDRITVRGYAQLRVNEIVSGDRRAPDGVSRLRSVHDGGIGDDTNFAFRRIRLILQGDLSDRVSFYLQPDFATAVSNQSAGERREGFAQLRDAYVDIFFGQDRRTRLRFGQSKVPFGWENLQSSSSRLPLDRSDGINSAMPSERDIGVVLYHTPPAAQRIWDRLEDDGQKLFGNYGAFGVAAYNGQGTNRPEENDGLMTVVMATWPFELGGQVVELGGAAYRNRVRPERRGGGTSDRSFADERVGLHAILYPQPLGIQAEWNWGRGPEYDPAAQAITTRRLNGGYVQAMYRVPETALGPMMPYARWQRYRGGWKAIPDAPRLETDELELGVEFQPARALELTLAYAWMERLEADERRTGRAEGQVIRTQLQWNY